MKVLNRKPTWLVNDLNSEEWVCDDYADVKFIDGIEYIKVHKPEQSRTFLMRKDALRKKK
ncbi:MAG: hypothetical protein ACO294_05300 [Methylococcales bacterium]